MLFAVKGIVFGLFLFYLLFNCLPRYFRSFSEFPYPVFCCVIMLTAIIDNSFLFLWHSSSANIEK